MVNFIRSPLQTDSILSSSLGVDIQPVSSIASEILVRHSELSSSSRQDSSSSSTSSREVDEEDSERTETEEEVSDDEMPSTSSKKKSQKSIWIWDLDKKLVRLFNESKEARWVKPIVSQFPIKVEESKKARIIRARFSCLIRQTQISSGLLKPALWQIANGADSEDCIQINLEKIIRPSKARGRRSQYWTLELDARLINLFNQSTKRRWIQEIANQFEGQNGHSIASHFQALIKRCDPQTGDVYPSTNHKNEKQGAFAKIDLEKVAVHTHLPGRMRNMCQQIIASSKKSSEIVSNSPSSLNSSSTTGIVSKEIEEFEEIVEASGSVPLIDHSGANSSIALNNVDPSLLEGANILFSLSSTRSSGSSSLVSSLTAQEASKNSIKTAYEEIIKSTSLTGSIEVRAPYVGTPTGRSTLSSTSSSSNSSSSSTGSSLTVKTKRQEPTTGTDTDNQKSKKHRS